MIPILSRCGPPWGRPSEGAELNRQSRGLLDSSFPLKVLFGKGGDARDNATRVREQVAQTIPTTLPSKASQGEQRLFAVLKRLPDDVLVYYEPIIDNRHPDFVVILPTLGVLLIEVKGWYLPEIVGGDSHSIRVREGEREVEHVHPLRQVSDYKFLLMKRCSKDTQISKLVNLSGPYTGKFLFPFASFALLSNITRENLSKWPEKSQEVFPSATVATRDQLPDVGMSNPTRQVAPTLVDAVRALASDDVADTSSCAPTKPNGCGPSRPSPEKPIGEAGHSSRWVSEGRSARDGLAGR